MLQNSTLGKKVFYKDQYDPTLLFPISRIQKRQEIGITENPPFFGYDTWNAYELSWLNSKGKPIVALARFDIACDSKNLIESKSFKLYLNSFNNTKFPSFDQVQAVLQADIANAAAGEVRVALYPLQEMTDASIKNLGASYRAKARYPENNSLDTAFSRGTTLLFRGMTFLVQDSCFDAHCLDDMDIEIDTYTVSPHFLMIEKNKIVHEKMYSNLLKSNCLVTGQPDWGSVMIEYSGSKINHAGLLKYIISFRHHNEFHEQCVERIFMDILTHCQPEKLTVHARYTRRGGLDINPIRSTEKIIPVENIRMVRQ